MRLLLMLVAAVNTSCLLDGTLAPLTNREPGAPQDQVPGCTVPVPDQARIDTPVWGVSPVYFYIPHVTWALAAAHASYRFEGLAADNLNLRLSPSFVLATALEESFLGCDATTAANPSHPDFSFGHQTDADADGCFQIGADTAWLEICRLFPSALDCSQTTHADVISSAQQQTTGRSNFEPGAMAWAYYNTVAYAMIPVHGLSDPDTWFGEAADPLAMEKYMAIAYKSGAWSTPLDQMLAGCHDDSALEDCLTPGSTEHDYVTRVISYAKALEAAVQSGGCYDADVSATDVDTYLARLAVLFVKEDWPTITNQVRAAFATASGGQSRAPFQQVAKPILDALAASMQSTLRCPAAELQSFYARQCPP